MRVPYVRYVVAQASGPKGTNFTERQLGKALMCYMYMSSEMSGEVDKNSIESQTAVKTLFASMRLYSKVPEIDILSFHPSAQIPGTHIAAELSDTSSVAVTGLDPDAPRQGEESNHAEAPNDSWIPTQGLIPAAKTCLTELRAKRLAKAASTAFFERRPRVKGIDLAASTISEICIKRWALATTAIETYPTITENQLFHSHHENRCLISDQRSF